MTIGAEGEGRHVKWLGMPQSMDVRPVEEKLQELEDLVEAQAQLISRLRADRHVLLEAHRELVHRAPAQEPAKTERCWYGSPTESEQHGLRQANWETAQISAEALKKVGADPGGRAE